MAWTTTHAVTWVAVISLVPPLLNAIVQPRPVTFLWASPLLFLLWSLCLPIAYLAACSIVDNRRPSTRVRTRSRSSSSGAALPRLSFLSSAAWSASNTRLGWARSSSGPARPPIYPASSHFSDAFDDVIHLIMRDFVLKWHVPLSTGSTEPSPSQMAPEFAHAVESVIRAALDNVKGLVTDLDLANFVVRKLLPRITSHLDSYRRAEIEFRGTLDDSHLAVFGSDQMDLFLAGKYENGVLHPAVGDMSSLHTKPAEQAFLRTAVTRLLQAVLPFPEIESPSVVIVVREILSCTILSSVIDMLSDPDFWNNLLEQKAGAVLHEQVLVGKLREALDKQDPNSLLSSSPKRSPAKTSAAAAAFAAGATKLDLANNFRLHWPGQDSKRPDQRSFEAFLKGIRETTSLLEARRNKADVAMQIRKTKTALERLSDDPDSASSVKLHSYLRRLEKAHSIAELRVLELGSNKGVQASQPSRSASAAAAGADPHSSRAKLHDVLLNPSSLSFFMEFMDRRQRSILVQFWLIVDSFKAPLEDPDIDPQTEREQMDAASKATSPSRSAVKTLRDDLFMFDSVYYASPTIKVHPRLVENAKKFIRDVDRDANVTALQVYHARRSVLKAQKEVLEEMQDEDWPLFKKSDLFLKAVQDLSPNPVLTAGLASSVAAAANNDMAIQSSRDWASDADAHLNAVGSRHVRTPVRTSAKGDAFQHADLFGTDTPLGSESISKKVDLFGDSVAGGSRSKASSKAGNLDILIGGRTQHAGPDGRVPLFREDPLFDDAEDEDAEGEAVDDRDGDEAEHADSSSEFVQVERMDAIQSALQSIIDEDLDRNRASDTHNTNTPPAMSASGHSAGMRKTSDHSIEQRAKGRREAEPYSVGEETGDQVGTTLARSGPGKTAGVRFQIDGDEDDTGADTLVTPTQTAPASPIMHPNPKQEIERLRLQQEKLESQADILEALIRKAELTGARAGEMRLLVQSLNAVRRESRDLRWQQDQYEKQLADSQLVAGHTRVKITGTMISVDQEGKDYAVYLIEVALSAPPTPSSPIAKKADSAAVGKRSRSASNATASAVARGWIVGRRYSEFWTLHQALKDRYPEVRALENEFPGKRLVGLTHAPFVDARKAALERYLQALVKLPVACESEELRLFFSQAPMSGEGSSPMATSPSLSRKSTETGLGSPNEAYSADGDGKASLTPNFPGRDFVKTIFKSMTGVAEGLDDLIGIGPSMLDVVMQRLSSQVAGQSKMGQGQLVQGIADIDMVSQAMNENATAAELREAAGAGTSYWTEPICDLFVSLFELKENNNWLRRQAIVILLQQIFGSTVERKVRETFSNLISPNSLTNYLGAFKQGLWPNGELKQPTPPRSQHDKDLLRENANRKLSTLVPELAANFVGRENARRGTRRIFAALQNKRLNKHLIYSLLDLCFDEILPPPPPPPPAKQQHQQQKQQQQQQQQQQARSTPPLSSHAQKQTQQPRLRSQRF
ncbi:hypothetical protein BCV70DRAFT_200292 [Testicularia cyperi]|uniref:PXA domain-containing protein n=1 Tax=Testicularia cyperi TaxID=1882483 RepID=A0A317XS53_9BASI|nr:hypothetical protein BCV70DRAFT_200292 [Testicularia cyperi]